MTRSAGALPELVLDGATFDDLEGFYDSAGVAFGTKPWGKNLNAFNDILRGGFGTPEDGFILRWVNSDLSAQRLGWPETIRSIPSNTS